MRQELLKDRRAKIAMWVVGAIIFGIWANATWVDRVRVTERKVQVAFGQLKFNLIARSQLLPQFIEIIKNYAPNEQAVLQELTTNYEYSERYQPPEQILTNPKLAAEYTQLENAVVQSVVRMHNAVKANPALMQNRQYFLLLNQWDQYTKSLASSELLLNTYIGIYNSYIIGFPQGFYNKITYRFTKKIPSHFSGSN